MVISNKGVFIDLCNWQRLYVFSAQNVSFIKLPHNGTKPVLFSFRLELHDLEELREENQLTWEWAFILFIEKQNKEMQWRK